MRIIDTRDVWCLCALCQILLKVEGYEKVSWEEKREDNNYDSDKCVCRGSSAFRVGRPRARESPNIFG